MARPYHIVFQNLQMEGFALGRNCLPHFHIKVQIKSAVTRSLLGGTCTSEGT